MKPNAGMHANGFFSQVQGGATDGYEGRMPVGPRQMDAERDRVARELERERLKAQVQR